MKNFIKQTVFTFSNPTTLLLNTSVEETSGPSPYRNNKVEIYQPQQTGNMVSLKEKDWNNELDTYGHLRTRTRRDRRVSRYIGLKDTSQTPRLRPYTTVGSLSAPYRGVSDLLYHNRGVGNLRQKPLTTSTTDPGRGPPTTRYRPSGSWKEKSSKVTNLC